MSVKNKCHTACVLELFELLTVAFTVALMADLLWVVYEIIISGISVGLFLVFSGLLISFIIVLFGLSRYHIGRLKEIKHNMMVNKIKAQRSRNRRKRRDARIRQKNKL